MSAREPSDRDELVARIAAGDLAEDSPEAARLLAEDPDARRTLDEIRALTESLDRAGGEEREVLERSRSASDAPGTERVASLLAELASSSRGGERATDAGDARAEGGRAAAPPPQPPPRPAPGTRARRPLPSLRLVAAAAALLAFLGLLWLLGPGSGEPADEPVYLGTGGVELLAPADGAREWGTFRWTGRVPAGGWFVLEIRDAAAPPGSPPLVREELAETEWEPTVELPSAIRVRLAAHGPGGELVGSLSRELSLSR